MTTTGAILIQRMQPVLPSMPTEPTDPLLPIVAVTPLNSIAPEGNVITFRIARTVNSTVPCSVNWVIVSTGGAGDFTGNVSGTAVFVANGTNIIDVSVTTVKRSGLQGTRDVSFTLSSPVSCAIDMVNITAHTSLTDVIEVIPDPPTPPSDPGEEYPPATSGREFFVTSRDAFISRYSEAVGGDHIIVKDAVNLGSLSLDRNGTSTAKPIVIRSEGNPTTNSAFLGGGMSIKGQYNTIWGIRANKHSVGLSGNYSKVRRVWFFGSRIRTATSQPAQLSISGRGNNMEYCSMGDCDSRGIRFTSTARAGKVLHCYFYDFTVNATDQTYEPIQLGDGASTYNDITKIADGFEVGWIYARNCNQNNKENECPTIKFSYVHMHDCHFNSSKSSTCRFARFAKIYRVRIENGAGPFFICGGPDHILNSVWANRIDLDAGNWDDRLTPDPPSGAGAAPGVHIACMRTKLVGCKGPVNVGNDYNNLTPLAETGYKIFKATDIKIEAHVSGSINNVQGGSPTWTTSPTASESIDTPPTYNNSSQGVFADLI